MISKDLYFNQFLCLRYGEVYWTMMDAVPLDQALVERFKGKVMAIVGYEADQVLMLCTNSLFRNIVSTLSC